MLIFGCRRSYVTHQMVQTNHHTACRVIRPTTDKNKHLMLMFIFNAALRLIYIYIYIKFKPVYGGRMDNKLTIRST